MEKKKIYKFNVKNVKFAIPGSDGSYAAAVIASLGGADSISLEAQYNEQKIYADGDVAFVLPSDKGLSGKIGMIYIDDAYEIAMGRKMEIDGGIADIQQLSTIEHALYFETDGVDDADNPIVLKTWMFNATSGKYSENYNQTTETVNGNPYEIPINVLGVNLKDSAGVAEYKDANGKTRKVWKLVSAPGMTNYATFGDSVPTPKAKAAV